MTRPEDQSGLTSIKKEIQYGEAEHYLETLIGPDWASTTLVFQTFDDNRDRRRTHAEQAKRNGKKTTTDPYARIHTGTWEKCKDVLTTINKNGGGVYLTVNETAGGRTVEKLQAIRAIWCEWDQATPPPDWPLAPHIVVESSPEKFHFYWKTDGLSANDHHRLMQVMVGKWGSDPNAADVVRVLRVPGFIHRKIEAAKGYKGIPWGVRLASAEADFALPPYPLTDLVRAFGVEAFEAEQQIKPHTPDAAHAPRFTTPINIIEVREALSFISPEERTIWLKMGMALASTHHQGAFPLWDEWSRSSPKYDEDDQYRVWQSFRENKGAQNGNAGVTLGTLYKMAKAAGWDRDAGWSKHLLTTARGELIDCPANIALILRHSESWSGALRFNTFTGKAEQGAQVYDDYGRSAGAAQWSDTADAQLADFLLREYRMPVKHLGHCTQAVENVARDQTYDPITTWLDSLPPWDGEEHLANFFSDFCHVPLTPYSVFCGRSFFIALVARAYQPGVQVDTVLVLEGAEGVRKTSLCRLLGGPWYKALSVSFETKDLFLALRRAWIAELAELDAFARAGQNRIKSLITTLSDSYRPSYGRNEIDQPRRTVFLGTTNDPVYIVDPYGARRFLPLRVGAINLEAVAAVMPQLFAEARERFQAGEHWWTNDEEVTEEANEIRAEVREIDPWEDVLRRYVLQHPGEILMVDLFSSLCLDVPVERQTRAMQTRIGIVMKTLGYRKKRRRAHDDVLSDKDNLMEYYYVHASNYFS